MKIHDKVLLIAHYRYSLEVDNLFDSAEFIQFDKIYTETVEYLVKRIKKDYFEGYGKRQITEDALVDIFRIQHQYLFDKYMLLLFELNCLGIKSSKTESELEHLYQSVYGVFIEKGFVKFEYATVTEILATMFFIFFATVKGSLVEKIKLLINEVTLTEMGHYIFEYLKGETF